MVEYPALITEKEVRREKTLVGNLRINVYPYTAIDE